MSYVYLKTEAELFTVGFYEGDIWHAESDHASRAEAAARVSYLNGGNGDGSTRPLAILQEARQALAAAREIRNEASKILSDALRVVK